MKLLAGVYVPTSGRITVDGLDLASFDPEALERWQRRVAPIVQEFARFRCPRRTMWCSARSNAARTSQPCTRSRTGPVSPA